MTAHYLGAGHFFFPLRHDEQIVMERLNAIFEEIQAAEGLIIDMRGSGGGSFPLMREVISRLIQEPVSNFQRRWLVSDYFLKFHEWGTRFGDKKGLTEWMFDGWGDLAEIEPTSGHRLLRQIPILMLTDWSTLSRSEALIMLLKEAGIAKTLGEVTGGGYAVPMQISLPETGWGFKYSVCEGRSPKGFDIEGKGVKPDFPVALGLGDLGSDQDRYLGEAERLLLELIG